MMHDHVVAEKQKTQVTQKTRPAASDDLELGHPLLRAQNVIGNHGLLRLADGTPLQRRLEVGAPGDEYEREADRIADEVMAMPDGGSREWGVRNGREAEPSVRLAAASSVTPVAEVAPEVEAQIQAIRSSGGRPLSTSERAFFEPRFGRDFARVRVHDGSRAELLAHAVEARAFTVGSDIFGSQVNCRPSRESGLLLAHELTHVAQQIPVVDSSHLSHRTVEDGNRAGDVRATRGCAFSEALRPTGSVILQRKDETDDAEKKRRLGETSTPLASKDVEVDPTSGGVKLERGGVDVVVLPDAIDASVKEGAVTEFSFEYRGIDWEADEKGVVTKVTGPGKPKCSIRTTYSESETAQTKSAYGRGTTPEDVKAGRTSVRHHEGGHGSAYLEFLAVKPYPLFSGSVKMKVVKFKAAISEYYKAVKEYERRMNDFSVQNTDCVGTTIDVFNKTKGKKTAICKKSP